MPEEQFSSPSGECNIKPLSGASLSITGQEWFDVMKNGTKKEKRLCI